MVHLILLRAANVIPHTGKITMDCEDFFFLPQPPVMGGPTFAPLYKTLLQFS